MLTRWINANAKDSVEAAASWSFNVEFTRRGNMSSSFLAHGFLNPLAQ